MALIKAAVTDRYVYSLDATPITYFVREYRPSTNEIILKRLFDSNGILLDEKQTTINLVATNENTFFTNYQMYTVEEENDIKHEALNSKEHVFTVKYQLLHLGDEGESEVECMPVEIYPPGLKVQDYDIRFDKDQDRITEIRNKQLGLVKFAYYKIDEACGYVQGSVMRIYTSPYQGGGDMLNLIHVHVNDTSDEVTIDVAYMQEGESIKEHEEFKADYTGQVLRYKILVRD